jgi:hypothetical protein
MRNLKSTPFGRLTASLFLGLLLIGGLVLALVGTASPAFAQSCSVPGTHATIQLAIDAGAGVCDTITVSSGTFNENLTIGRSLTLNGMGKSSTTIDGSSGTRVITITGPSITVNMSNLRVTGGDASNTSQAVGISRIGGGILVENGATLNLDNARVDNNLAFDGVTRGGFGGGIGIYNGSTLYAQDVDIDNNIASSGANTGFGGGVAVISATAYITNATVYSNVAKPAGGGQGLGGGLYAAGETGSGSAILYLSDSQVSSNTAYRSTTGGDGRGGGLYVGDSQDTQIYLNGNSWQGNVARSSTANAGDGDGGGIAINPTTLAASATINQDTLTGNVANASNGPNTTQTAKGGGLFTDSTNPGTVTLMLTDVTMTQNTAKSGTGTAHGQGGAMYAENANITYEGGTLAQNKAGTNGSDTGDGGAIRLSQAPLTASKLTIRDNTALENGSGTNRGRGGAIALFNGGGTAGALNITNSFIVDNVANTGGTREGAGVYLNDPNLGERSTLVYVTLAAASAASSEGVYADSGALSITNTIVASHTVGLFSNGGDIDYNYVLFFGNSINDASGSPPPNGGANLFSGNPDFVDPANRNYHIRFNSPAIDAAIDEGITDDIDGDFRPDPDSSGFDIGADEFTLSKAYMPVILKNYP